MRLTKTAIAGLMIPAGKSYLLVFDDGLPGFGVKVNQTNRQYVVQYRVHGVKVPKRETIARVDRMSLDEAREHARRVLLKASTGSDPSAEKARARAQARVTFGTVADSYLKRAKAKLKPRSFVEVERHILKQWAGLHDTPIHAVTRADIASRLGTIAEASGPVAANRARVSLSTLFTWAMREGLTEANPAMNTNKAIDEAAIVRDRVLSADELRTVLNHCRDDDFGRIVRLLAMTGQRRDEVAAMAWPELDLDRALWSIPAARTKNKRPHDVPLPPAAVALLRAVPRREGRILVFGEGKGGFSGWSASKTRMDARIAKAGIELQPWRLHDLRRTLSTGMAEDLGVLPHVIEAVINHVSGHKKGVAGTYNRATYASEKRDALNRWARHLEALTAPASSEAKPVKSANGAKVARRPARKAELAA